MKLIFTKNDNNEINVQLQNGTLIEDFSYTEMINQLLVRNVFDNTEFNGLSEDEKIRVQGMLERVVAVFQDEAGE